jgi:predicted aconitase
VGAVGVELLEKWVATGARFVVPTDHRSRSTDPGQVSALQQDEHLVDLDRRVVAAMSSLGAVPCNTCTNYQILDMPVFGERLGWGDTGSVIWGNSVAGARSNYGGGPAALAAALCGRSPTTASIGTRCGAGRCWSSCSTSRDPASDWGGRVPRRRAFPRYWEVPVFVEVERAPTPDESKQLGAVLASYGSQAMFHMVGVTPEARSVGEVFDGREPRQRLRIEPGDIAEAYAGFRPATERPDLVVLGTPQLSLFEFKELSEQLRQHAAHAGLLTTGPQVKQAAARSGYLAPLEDGGITVLSGVCYYLMAPRELTRVHGFQTLSTNSA